MRLLVFTMAIPLVAGCASSSDPDDSEPTPNDAGGLFDATISATNDATVGDAMLAGDGPGADGTLGDAGGAAGTTLITYPDVPGLAPSTHYAFRARLAALEGTDAGWQESFALVTSSSSDGDAGYWTGIANWTNSYTNIAADGPVELEISRVDGTPIQSAATHPVGKATSTQVTGGKAYVTLPGPALVAVDIDGQMDTQDTGIGYSGPPIHTVTLFANPLPDPLPDAGDPSVVVVQPGDTPPSTGSWTTLLFAPGVHDIGLGFPVHAGKTYVVPGDAIVYGTILQTTPGDGDDNRHQRIRDPLGCSPHPAEVPGALPRWT